MSDKKTILIVEDDLPLAEALIDTLEIAKYHVIHAENGMDALALLKQQNVSMVISDVHMKKMDGHTLLTNIQQHYPSIPVLLMTAYATVEKAVEAMRLGAVDYLVKPFEAELLISAVERYFPLSLRHEGEVIAEDEQSKQLFQLAKRVAVSDATVMISGESGTGKEVVAQYIHNQSQRTGPFVAINCVAIPDNMLESTLFGYEKGAFTGAVKAMPGKFEQANGGTLLLDEVSEMALPLQAKLLRVLQERIVERLGSQQQHQLDVRVLATSNQDMKRLVDAGEFREDLYYRLNVFPLKVTKIFPCV